jgi:hypothetical protein
MRRNIGSVLLFAGVTANIVANVQGKELWSSQPATTSDLIRTAYTLGNGRLGGRIFFLCFFSFKLTVSAMPLGGVGSDYVNLNVDSLWTGGPFENSVIFTRYHIYLDTVWIFMMKFRTTLEVTRQVRLCTWCKNCSTLFLNKAMGVRLLHIHHKLLKY